MKKLAFAFSVVILSCFITCTNNSAHEGGTSEKANKNLENTKAIINMFVTGDFSKVGDYVATNGVDHSGPQGEVKGLDNLKAMFAQMMSTMSDAKNEVVKGLADDDYSMVWVKQSWTQKTDDPMMGMKAGQHGDMQSIEVCKHGADGKITDHWSFMSMADMMKMMPQAPKDTTGNK
jgi:predicted ester cyclase